MGMSAHKKKEWTKNTFGERIIIMSDLSGSL